MFAAISPRRKYLTLAVVNATDSEQKFDLGVTGARLAGPATLWQMNAQSFDAANRVGEAPQVAIRETALGDAPYSLSVAPISINIYRLPISQAAR